MQPVDLTTLRAVWHDLSQHWLPARLETIQQIDLWTICFCLRTLNWRGWVLLSWHPQAARLHLCQPPAKAPDPFQFSQPLQRHLKGLALTQLALVDPWERVLDWQFAPRPGDLPLWHLYLEIMGKYSNAVLVDREGLIVACGHGVSERQSSVRPVQPGLTYQLPPALLQPCPSLQDPLASWRDRVSVRPGKLTERLLQSYRGLSTMLVVSMLAQVNISPRALTTDLEGQQWQALYQIWQEWLTRLQQGSFQPGWTAQGYTVLGWDLQRPAASVHQVLETYYGDWIQADTFQRERHRLLQKLSTLLQKLYQRRAQFDLMLQQAERADEAKLAADLLMAHLQDWQPGLQEITLPDFTTDEPMQISLDPEKNAILNAQAYYKKHRKQKRARDAVLPLRSDTEQEIRYLEQVEASLQQLDCYRSAVDLTSLMEIRAELIEQHYLTDPQPVPHPQRQSHPQVHRFTTATGLEVWVGRNNHQNDWLTFKLAQDQDWWFHAQEIGGSHVVLRLPPGTLADDSDLQLAANLAAHFSQGRLSDQVPVVYTHPKHVYKPKGSRPGMVVYKHETVIWAHPNSPEVRAVLEQTRTEER